MGKQVLKGLHTGGMGESKRPEKVLRTEKLHSFVGLGLGLERQNKRSRD